MRNRAAVKTVTRSNGYSYLLFRYRRGEIIKIVPPTPAQVQKACEDREKAIARMRLIDDLL